MDIIVVDFSGCKSSGDIHTRFMEKLGFPNYYGKNWDELWDMLTGYLEYPLIIKLKGLNSLPLELSDSVKELIKVFQDAKKVENGLQFITEN